MKYIFVALTMIIILTALIVSGGCATNNRVYISKAYDIYGTWGNPDAKPVIQYGKMEFQINGELDSYNTVTSTTPMTKEYVVTNKWVDSGGNVFYTIIIDMGVEIGLIYGLAKISNSGNTLELSISNSDYPKEIDPEYTEYFIGYRQ